MQEDDGIAWTEVILNSPFNGKGALVAEIDGDRDFAVGASGGGDRWKARGGWLVQCCRRCHAVKKVE